ncbi:hypothetical protein [Undibacterium fentianense]|uniref:DUF4124 domain-containing protein n=1 Tax=Undibacterium fentianense TaxID=2828728 RepID=A0A941IFH3_9BURK|nr:hypothetical protein [Undibacterium fentianense]MBR7800716.1 hypothetical protein [Undibacterium fentianense]
MIGLILPLTLNHVVADIFRCTNAQGKILTSDRPISECQNRGMKVYSNDGRFKTEISAPMSVEEKQKLALEAERQREIRQQEEERKKEERFLMAHFHSENDIEVARKKAVEVLIDKKRLATEQLTSLSEILGKMQAEVKNTKKTAKELEALRQRAEDMSTNILTARKAIGFYDQEILRTHTEFDQTLQRYRTIVIQRR